MKGAIQLTNRLRIDGAFVLTALCACLAGCSGGGSTGPQVSSNTRLAALTASAGELWPAFEPSLQSYVVGPGLLAGSTTLTATPEDPGATVEVNQVPVPVGVASDALPLELGMTPATVTVTAPDGTQATYAVMFERYRTGEQEFVKASNAQAEDLFGNAVAISGDTLVVGAPREDGDGAGGEADDSTSAAGAVYVYTRTESGWSQQAYLKAAQPGEFDSFGFSVAISGDTLAVGALHEDNDAPDGGAVHVFTRIGSTWTEQALLGASNPDSGDYFGYSLSLAGDVLVVGAPRESSSAMGGEDDDSAQSAGAAYVFTRSGSSWSQQARLKASNAESLDQFGFSVAISGDTLVVGAEGEDASGSGGEQDNSMDYAGAAYVFTRTEGSWTQRAYLKASTPQQYTGFGSAVAISGETLVVGVYREASSSVHGEGDDLAAHSGAAYVFTRMGASWSQQAFLKAYNAEETDRFGISVAISGDTILVGAYDEDSRATGGQADNDAPEAGAAYVFTRTGTSWLQHEYLKAFVAQAGDKFGASVAIDGDALVVGAPGESASADGGEADESEPDAGAVYVNR